MLSTALKFHWGDWREQALQHQVDSTHSRGEENQGWPFVELREGVLGLTVNLEREVTASFCNTHSLASQSRYGSSLTLN